MAKFFYIARDAKGQKVSGAEEGYTQEDILNRLQAKGLLVVSLIPETKETPGLKTDKTGARLKFKHYGLTNDDLVLFCRQLATLLGSGVTILKSIDIITMQVSSYKLYQILKKLEKDMEGGLSLHEAMAKHPAAFTELWVNLCESGEASGNLAMVLSRLAGYLERDAEFKRKIISALIYPGILFMVASGALLFMTIKIIPTFAELFISFNIKLPVLTQILIAFSTFLRKFFLLIILGIGGVVFLFRNYIKTKEGRRRYEQFLLKLPLMGDFIRALIIERFSSEMSTLVESGVPILYSLDIVEHSVNSVTMSDIIRNIKDDVRGGKTLSQPLDSSGFFDAMVVQMVAIGEEIGELPQMFKKINSFYQEYVETFLTRFSSMFEPIMLLFMGGVIGIMVIGMFLPIFQIAKIGGQ